MFYPVIWICGDCYWDWHLDMRLQRVLAVAALFRVLARWFFDWILLLMRFRFIKILGLAGYAVAVGID